METTASFPVRDYDLAATLTSGQAFRWKLRDNAWESIIHGRRVRLCQLPPLDVGCSMLDVGCSPSSIITATTSLPQPDWHWLTDYLRLNDDHAAALATFPDDPPMRAALAHCHGLRLLRQEPWECLASFILSSTKQIVQIQQCVALLCERFGEAVNHVPGRARHSVRAANGRKLTTAMQRRARSDAPYLEIRGKGRGEGSAHFAFPTHARIAAASEAELRACKIGFRAKYLHAAARMVASGELDLARIQTLPLEAAREELMRCPGVGRKIADCALLFSCGFDAAFPIDVWVERALQQLYFPKRKAKRARLERFAATHFGPHAGLAQQYLFHYLRTGGSDRTD